MSASAEHMLVMVAATPDNHLRVRVAVGEEKLQMIRLRAVPEGLRHALGARAVGAAGG